MFSCHGYERHSSRLVKTRACRATAPGYDANVTVELPDQLAENLGLTPELVKLNAAAGLYARGEATLGQAAELAGLGVTDMMHELGRRNICMNYGLEDLEHDLKMVDVLLAKMGKK